MNNIDVEEFVNKIINDDLIRTIELDFINSDIDKYFKEFRGIPDDYDQKQDYGMYTGDSENARNHLLDTLNIVYRKNNDRNVVSEYERTVQRDLKNWFKCIDVFEYHKEMPEVFCIMVRLGYGKIVCDQVEAEYQSFEDSKEYLSIDDLWIPDYAELYREFADYCLFVLGDAKLARRFYYLTVIDWFGILNEDVCDRRYQISKEKKIRIEQNNELISELDHYFDLLPMCKSGKYKKISDVYNSYLRERNSKYNFSEKIMECLLDFVKLREKCWNSCSVSIKRILLIISHRLREDAIADIVVVLCKEDLNLDVKERMLDWLQNSYDTRLISAHRLVERFREDEEVLKAVDSLMKTRIHIREILLHLKINIQKWQKPLVYYTSLATFCYMLPNWNKANPAGIDRFSVMNIAYMNDPTEGKKLQQLFQQSDKSGCWRQYLSRAEGQRINIEYPYVFMKCFTSLVDDLPMWEMYGDKASGCCVVLDPKTFWNRQENDTIDSLYQICYIYIDVDGELRIAENHDSQNSASKVDTDSVEDALRQIRDIGVQLFQKEKSGSKLYYQACAEFVAMLDQIRFLFKSADYKHEQEVRLLYVYPQADEAFLHTDEKWPKLYVQPEFSIQIREIIMGPKCKKTYKFMPYLQEQIAKMFERNTDFELPRITMSGIQYQ